MVPIARAAGAALASFIVAARGQTFTNPVIWEDLPDNEVHRVGDAFYMTSSTFHYSPGAPVMRSYDLVNWEHIGHSVPVLDFGPGYSLEDGERAYVDGIWASSLRHRESEGKWYFVTCIGFSNSYIYSASNPGGPYDQVAEIGNCYYDAGLLFDDKDTPYVAYGNDGIRVAQLAQDLTSEVSNNHVFTPPDGLTLEGSRMYLKDGNYYIFLTRPPDGQYMIKSTEGPWGPYEMKNVLDNIPLTAVPAAGAPHQGSLVDTPNGDWYYMAFSDMYPGGRCPVLAPIQWGGDGFPIVTTVNGEWGNYDYPLDRADVPSVIGTYNFSGASLRPDWEWNHNPDTDGFTVDNGLTLRTVTVTDDLYWARNTLTHRIRGPQGTATVTMDISNMADGDRAGFGVLRDESAWIGVEREGNEWSLVVVTDAILNDNGTTRSTGTVSERQTGLSPGEVHLRVEADIRPYSGGSATFSYSTDGDNFQAFGPNFVLNTDWVFFPGYRYGIHNFATKSLGGSVHITSFNNT